MDEKRDYTTDAPSANEKQALLSQFAADVRSNAPQSTPAAVNAPTTPPRDRSSVAAERAIERENQRTDFIQRLYPGHIPLITPEQAEDGNMGHLTTPRSNSAGAMMTVLVGVALLWFMLTATGGVEYVTNRMGDQRQVAASGGQTQAAAEKRLVPLEAHVMSKCPDTKVCFISMRCVVLYGNS